MRGEETPLILSYCADCITFSRVVKSMQWRKLQMERKRPSRFGGRGESDPLGLPLPKHGKIPLFGWMGRTNSYESNSHVSSDPYAVAGAKRVGAGYEGSVRAQRPGRTTDRPCFPR